MKKHDHVALKFAVGDRVVSRKYGRGVVTDVDADSPDFCYNVSFEDGTKAWYDGRGTVLDEGDA